MEGWLNRKSDDPEFQQRSENVCQTYLNAPVLAAAEQPTPTRSLDEKTGSENRNMASVGAGRTGLGDEAGKLCQKGV